MKNILHLFTLWKLRRDPRAMRRFSDTYWQFILSLIGVLVAAGIGAGVYLFLIGGINSIQGPAVQGGEETLTRANIQTVVDLYEQRRLHFDSVVRNGIGIPDPSKR